MASMADDIERAVRDAIAEARRLGRPVWRATTLGAAPRPFHDAAWRLAGLSWGFVTPDGRYRLGWGEQARMEASRFGWRLWRAQWQVPEEDSPPRALPWGGAFAFGRGRWDGFPAAAFSLPALLLEGDRGQATLTVIVRADPFQDPARVAADYRALWQAATAPPEPEVARIERVTGDGDRSAFQALVARAEQACAAGRLEKVVVARRVDADVRGTLTPESVFTRVVAANPETFRFFVRKGRRVFLGASPETLVQVHGAVVRTMALAGTTRRDAGEDLLHSEKDRREHEWVRRYIGARLAQVAAPIRMPAEPEVRWVGAIGHLYTPVEGLLRPGLGIWDAARVLHPTPAVGGTPTREALRFLQREEHLVRGWYAGGVGWADLEGNGWLAVAIRSLLWDGVRGRVSLFAGSGIVAGSRPDREWEETEWKLGPMWQALMGPVAHPAPVP